VPEPTLVIKGGRLIDATGERNADVVVGDDGTVLAVGTGLDAPRTLDAGGCVVSPGLVDLHAHLRQPGKEEAETIETGSRCAALGGFTAVVAMPNTTPAIDSAAVVREVQDLARTAMCEVAVAGAITLGRRGDTLAPMAEMAALGVRLFTDDGSGVEDNRLMRRALEYASGLPQPVVLAQHCEDGALNAGGHMHEGEWSARLGIPGQPAEAEELMVMRDIALARLTGQRVHFQHLSTAGSVVMVRAAKAAGLPVSAEATAHHLALTDALCASYDPVFKVNPPLRTTTDVLAVRDGLADGAIDAIATDHAPHEQEAKEQPFDQAPPGMLGLETVLAVALTTMAGDADPPDGFAAEGVVPVDPTGELGAGNGRNGIATRGRASLGDVLGALSWRPASIAGLDHHGGPIVAGRAAHLAVIDPTATWTVDAAASASRSRNNPWAGLELRGKVRHTLWRGEPIVIDGEAQR
jgi:dihydroorotase